MILCDELDGDYAGITLEHAIPLLVQASKTNRNQ